MHVVLERRRELADLVLSTARRFISAENGGNARAKRFTELVESLLARTSLETRRTRNSQNF
jgi:hypothetical protein